MAKGEKSLLSKQKVTIVVQVNGKKRGLFIAKKDIAEKEVIKEAKKLKILKKLKR